MRVNINSKIKRSGIFLADQISELELCLAICLKIATQSGQEFSLKNRQFIIQAVQKYAVTKSMRLIKSKYTCELAEYISRQIITGDNKLFE